MSAGTVARVLREALDILRVDAPAAYHRVARELTGIAVDITVDAEMFNVQVLEDAVAVAMLWLDDVTALVKEAALPAPGQPAPAKSPNS